MRTHCLKVWREYFDDIQSGAKPFELRRNDRSFEVGDTLVLEEWDAAAESYTGRRVVRGVTYRLDGPVFGLAAGHCIMGLEAASYAETRDAFKVVAKPAPSVAVRSCPECGEPYSCAPACPRRAPTVAAPRDVQMSPNAVYTAAMLPHALKALETVAPAETCGVVSLHPHCHCGACFSTHPDHRCATGRADTSGRGE